eukprot:TRINITY_DN136214_c1_g1_i1.p1 TRINITY_DN136214_c1_g1~~TRINITY_DN136214_c1_g1_i1.p1  ORF type:complete len:155 (+),score=10.66 TRINITY_DN136214_c1_g1_i1:197-661(+)
MKKKTAHLTGNLHKELEVSLGQATSTAFLSSLNNKTLEPELSELKSQHMDNPMAKKATLAILELLELPPKTSITSHQFATQMAGIIPENIPEENLERAREYLSGINRSELERISSGAAKFYDGAQAILRYHDERFFKEEQGQALFVIMMNLRLI